MFYTDNEKTETMQKLNEYSALLSDIPSSPEDFCDLMEVKYGAMTDNPIHDEKDIGLRQMDLYQFAKSMADRC